MPRLVKIISVLLLAGIGCLGAGKPQLPRTLPGKRLGAMLYAFNSGDARLIRDFLSSNYSAAALRERSAEDRATTYLQLYHDSGGFDLRRVEDSGEHSITVLAMTRETEEWYQIACTVELTSPQGIIGLTFRMLPFPPGFVPRHKRSDAELSAELGRYVGKLGPSGMFSGVVQLARKGHTIFEQAVSPPEARPPYDMDTRFALGPISKAFTAVAVAQLQEQKLLGFLDPISKYLPEYPADRGITIHQLLTHTAGLEPFLDERSLEELQRLHLQSRDDVVRFLARRPLIAPPGREFHYSNADYWLLEAVVEHLSGKPFPEYLQQHIFAPAGMNATVGGTSTAPDMTRFANALLEYKLLPADATKFLMAGKVQTPDPQVRYAYGLEDASIDGVRVVGDSGGGPNISDEFDVYPDSGYSLVVLSRQPGATAAHVANKVRAMLVAGKSR